MKKFNFSLSILFVSVFVSLSALAAQHGTKHTRKVASADAPKISCEEVFKKKKIHACTDIMKVGSEGGCKTTSQNFMPKGTPWADEDQFGYSMELFVIADTDAEDICISVLTSPSPYAACCGG